MERSGGAEGFADSAKLNERAHKTAFNRASEDREDLFCSGCSRFAVRSV